MMTQQQWMYLAVALIVLAIGWRKQMLPGAVSSLLDDWVPAVIKDPIMTIGADAPAVPAAAVPAADAAKPKPECEKFETDAQCGYAKDACEWFENKCRSRPLTKEESGN